MWPEVVGYYILLPIQIFALDFSVSCNYVTHWFFIQQHSNPETFIKPMGRYALKLRSRASKIVELEFFHLKRPGASH